jgi:hypothetical protein
MSLQFNDGKITGSSGVAKAGLTLGIIGTSLAALNGGVGNGTGLLGGLFNGNCAGKDSEIAELRSARYTDQVGIELYREIIAQAKEEDAKIRALQKDTFDFIIDLDKKTALNEQAQRLNREYDTMARDYMFTILNNKLDCCCDKVNAQMAYNRELGELADASILSFVNSNFVPGSLIMPASSICPPVVTQ